MEFLITGAGDPVTLFVPGMGARIADTRPLGSGVAGRKVFVQLRGHGRSTTPHPHWRYADLAGDVAAVADHVAARRALGVSMGAGAVCRLITEQPDRFDRLVFFLPAVLDDVRSGSAAARLRRLSAAIAAGAHDEVARLVAEEIPERLRDSPDAREYAAQRAAHLIDRRLASHVASLADEIAVPDVAALGQVTAPALVLACRGDELHPVEVAERLAAALPSATLHVYDTPGVLFLHRADLRRRISEFLAG